VVPFAPEYRVFEVFLEPTRPFSVRASGKLEDLLDKAGEDRITVPGSAYSRSLGTFTRA
jgi:hypothetical protein